MVTSTAIVYERLRRLGATDSGISEPPGHPAEEPPLVVGQRIPGPHGVALRPALAVGARLLEVRVDRRQLGVLADDAHPLLAIEHELAVALVAHVELAAVLLDPLLRR